MMNNARLLLGQLVFPMAAVFLCGVMVGCADVTVRVLAEGDGQSGAPNQPDEKRKPLSVDSFVKPKFPEVTVKKNLSCPPSDEPRLVDPEKQETIAWCWAASAKMAMMAHLKKEFVPQQCSIVEDVLNPNVAVNCCSASSNHIQNECIQGGWPEWAFQEFGFEYEKVNSSEIKWEHLADNVCKNNPVIYAETYTAGSGHTYVVGGLHSEGDVRMVDIYSHDPDFLYAEDKSLLLQYRERRYETLSLQFGEGGFERRDDTFFYINIRPKS